MAIWRIINRIDYAGGKGPGFNTFHVRRDTTGPGADRFIEALEVFYTGLAGLLNSDTQITVGDSVTDVETAEFIESTPVLVDGGSTTSKSPRLLQLVVPWRTSVRARRGMGRTFVGPLAEGAMGLGGTPTTTAIDAVEREADELIATSKSLGLGAFGVWGYESAWTGDGPRPESSPKVLRDIIGRGSVRANGFSYLSSRRD